MVHPIEPNRLVLINRSFWPVYPVIGEALLRFAEAAVENGYSVSVVSQNRTDIKAELKQNHRGAGVSFYQIRALTFNTSHLFLRIFDTIFFMLCTFFILFWIRPKIIYVSTDPPVLVPFSVAVYSKLFKARYIYHIQDIHPEATNVIIPLNRWLYNFIVKIDVWTMQGAEALITLNHQMKKEILSRATTVGPIYIIFNPAVSFDSIDTCKPKVRGFSFCGNAGRMQRIPLLLESIEKYLTQNGRLEFVFAGGGIYAKTLKIYADRFKSFHYLGVVEASHAAQISAHYCWALLPIEDGVTRYAFPSKLSSYVCSGANVLAICGEETSVAKIVRKHHLGIVVAPNAKSLTSAFWNIESGDCVGLDATSSRNLLKKKLTFDVFVSAMLNVVNDQATKQNAK